MAGEGPHGGKAAAPAASPFPPAAAPPARSSQAYDEQHQEKASDVRKDTELEEDEPAAAAPPSFGPPYAPPLPPFAFWRDAVLLGLLGGALGCIVYGYLKAMKEVTDAWLRADGNDAFPAPQTLQFGGGRAWWVGLCGGAGLAVGLAKVALRLDGHPSFIEELKSMHVDPATGFKVAVVALLGLMGGVPMGPEAGLGGAAGALGGLLGGGPGPLRRRLRPLLRLGGLPEEGGQRRRIYTLAAMCSAFCSFLPNPLSGVLLTLELGNPLAALTDVSFMHLVALLSIGGTAGFAAYYGIAGFPYLQPTATFLLEASLRQYNQAYLPVGLLFGAIGAALGICYILIAALVKLTVGAARSALDARFGRWPRVVVLATAGGLGTGLLSWAMPLVATDGSASLGTVLTKGPQIGSKVLAASCFAKMLAYHLCSECGFSGGIYLPLLATSAMLGRVLANESGINPVVCMSCSLVALASAVAPAPFTNSVLAVSVLLVGTEGFVPVFATAVSAHLLCMGLGLPQALAGAAARRRQQRSSGATAACSGTSAKAAGQCSGDLEAP